MNDEENEKKVAKNPFKGGPLIAGLNLLEMQVSDSFRTTAMTDEVGSITVDTVCPTDTEMWETGLLINGIWVIVEQYESEQDAALGHKNWMEQVEKEPNKEYTDIFKKEIYEEWGFDEE